MQLTQSQQCTIKSVAAAAGYALQELLGGEYCHALVEQQNATLFFVVECSFPMFILSRACLGKLRSDFFIYKNGAFVAPKKAFFFLPFFSFSFFSCLDFVRTWLSASRSYMSSNKKNERGFEGLPGTMLQCCIIVLFCAFNVYYILLQCYVALL